jgi:hypothetical protein
MSAQRERRVSDLQLAAYLLARDHQIVRLEGPPHRRAFIFVGVPDEDITAFYGGRDAVSARKLFGAYRDLKGLTVQTL